MYVFTSPCFRICWLGLLVLYLVFHLWGSFDFEGSPLVPRAFYIFIYI